MKFEKFTELMTIAKMYYPEAKTLPNGKLGTELWYEQIKEFDFNLMKQGLDDYARTNQFPPRLCHFIDFGMATNEAEYPEPEQAWSILYKTICNSGYHAEEEFSKLPKYLQEAAGSPWNLRAMAATDEDTLNRTDKINFLISYKAIVKRYKENSRKTAATQSNVQKLNAGSDKGKLNVLIDRAVQAVESSQITHKPFLQIDGTNMPQSKKGMPETAITALESYAKDNYNLNYKGTIDTINKRNDERMMQKVANMEVQNG